ncbi:hypothetical protein FIA56_04380 [Testudinibacter sp. TR-2022]|uniref:Ig-like domain-containing protein n=1 Tax=Testudinibacter sp. TR-2022 TaxID=2585029 RepID=UPI00111B8065|nr:Ig-like domain-containing protein [Testudinibacter sp. TR-2022]TNH14806.1 hypothetical protein FIA56_04380 [Testudinibacter sp. TR-2022]
MTDKDGTEQTVTLTKEDAGWSADKPVEGMTVNTDGTVTFDKGALQDGSEVSAVATDGNANSSDAATATAPDSTAPTVDISMSDVNLFGNDTAIVTFTFSEKITEFDINDITAENGVLSNLNTTDDGVTWTATFTPNKGVDDKTNNIRVGAGYQDLAGNNGTPAESPNYIIDTKAPTLDSITILSSDRTNDTAGQTLKKGEKAIIAFGFSEEVSGFDLDDVKLFKNNVEVEIGTFSNLTKGALPGRWSVTFTPTADVEDYRNLTIKVADNTFTDLVGNSGTGRESAVFSVDTVVQIPSFNAKTTDGTVDVTLPLDTAKSAIISVTMPNGEHKNITLTKQGDTWVSSDVGVKIDGNKVTIPNDYTLDTSIITAKITDDAGNIGEKAARAPVLIEYTENSGYYGWDQLTKPFYAGNGEAKYQIILGTVDTNGFKGFVDGTKVNGFYYDQSGNYMIDGTTGNIYLTEQGAKGNNTTSAGEYPIQGQFVNGTGNAYNDYEVYKTTTPNGISKELIYSSTNGGDEFVSATFKINDVKNLDKLNVLLDPENGVNSTGTGAGSIFTTDGHDILFIGYSDEFSATTNGGSGNVQRDGTYRGDGAVLDLGAGDDFVRIRESIGTDLTILWNPLPTEVYLGEGNDKIEVMRDLAAANWVRTGMSPADGNSKFVRIFGGSKTDVITVPDTSGAPKVIGVGDGAGDDTVRVSYYMHNAYAHLGSSTENDDDVLSIGMALGKPYGDPRGIMDSVVEMGGGNDTVEVYGGNGIYGESYIRLSNGYDGKDKKNTSVTEENKVMTIGIAGSSVIEGGVGKDVIYIGWDHNRLSAPDLWSKYTSELGTMGGSSRLDLGAGDDEVTVGVIKDNALMNLGAGNDILTADRIIDTAQINMGDGNDIVIIKGIVQNGAKIDMGEGNNILTIGGGLNNNSSVTFGSGNDQLTINGQLGVGTGNPTISMGAGDDTVTWGGTSISSTNQIDGGAGKDTLILTTTTNTHTGSTNNPTNLGSSQFKGFEVIEMKNSGNSVDIRYSDLLSDTTNESPLYIKGVAGSKVDLGQNNYNSDSASSANLSDNFAGRGSWSKQSTTEVDGVSYDVYHHSAAGNNTLNDVYIQQGIIVI